MGSVHGCQKGESEKGDKAMYKLAMLSDLSLHYCPGFDTSELITKQLETYDKSSNENEDLILKPDVEE
ncbi:hypothetical protein BP5796_05319 [Coleophoma crateriformis]|uniref:Uncharacterized protein n=1 Tax=Coleophoma crateriformis TaxID=565419 RepID=A0A3D8S3F0_9HELO|nr:hypothetical protein BP5796_05319 [Coleophoma crateriformis]